MKAFLIGVAFALSSYVSGRSFHDLSYRPIYHNLNVTRRQDNQTIVGNLTNVQLQAGYAAQCSNITTNTGQNAIVNDISNVTANSQVIQTTFDMVLEKLLVINDENSDASQFVQGWSTLRQQWIDLLWSSITTASNASAYSKEFALTIMPPVMSACNLTAAIEALTTFKDSSVILETNANATVKVFKDLQVNLTTFAADFQKFAEDHEHEDQSEIDKLNEDIRSLKKEVDSLNVELVAVAAAMGVTVFADVAAAVLFPEFAAIILEFGVGAVEGEVELFKSLIEKKTEHEHDIATDQELITQLQSQLTDIANANSTLHTTANTTGTLTIQFASFDTIWKAVTHDCDNVVFFLNNPTSSVPLVAWAAVNNVPCYYQSMSDALDMYATGITSGPLPPASQNGAVLRGGLSSKEEFHQQAISIVSELDGQCQNHGGNRR